MGDRDDAGGDRGRRATTGPAGGVVGIPRVPGRSAEFRFGNAHDPELGTVRGTEDVQTGRLEAVHDLAGALGHPVGQGSAGVRAAVPAVHAVHVFDQEGDPAERARETVRNCQRLGIPRFDHSVEPRVHCVPTIDSGLQNLSGGDVTAGDEFGETSGVVLHVFVVAHAAQPTAAGHDSMSLSTSKRSSDAPTSSRHPRPHPGAGCPCEQSEGCQRRHSEAPFERLHGRVRIGQEFPGVRDDRGRVTATDQRDVQRVRAGLHAQCGPPGGRCSRWSDDGDHRGSGTDRGERAIHRRDGD